MMVADQLVLSLSDLAAGEHSRVGGKAVNLARLARQGFPVPPGFVVATDVYRQFMSASGLDAEVTRLVKETDPNDTTQVSAAETQIASWITSQSMPPDARDAILASYREVGGGAQVRVAVRSSGTAEDLEEASFAGLHDTHLGIVGDDQVVDAVRSCWASLWTARAIAYRTRNTPDEEVAIAVVVQQMVPAEAAGVMFTANPITTAVDEIVVNASPGLGESVVSGVVTPDEYVLRRDTLAVRKRTLGSKTTEIVMSQDGSGTTQRELASAGQQSWYDPTDESAFQDLISGLPRPTRQAQESHVMWDLAAGIKNSPAVTALFENHDAAGFFNAVATSTDPAVVAWNDAYEAFMDEYGSRGHADRDFFYDRRTENPVVDYDAFSNILSSGMQTTPNEIEERLATNREAATARVIAYLERQPLGRFRAQAFRVVLDYVHRFLCLRDDERWWADWMTMAKKRSFQEIGRRCVERGRLEDGDFYFLARRELEEVLDGRAKQRLVHAKVTGRRTAFHKFLAREEMPPMHLKGSEPLIEDDGDEGLVGAGTSRGTVTARARIVPHLSDLGRVQPGDILICNSTDPGWTSVFLKITGLVIETGGMLAHGSCLSREYGIPAVTLHNAMNRIPDGATITVDGNTGRVTVLDDQPVEETALAQA